MSTFGENLRRERELRGVTLPELANATKVGLRHLQALEKDQFDRLPGGVFSRGFVRSVARYMNLDEAHWVAEFARASREPPEVLARLLPPPSKQAKTAHHRGVWSFVLLVVVFAVGAYLVHEVREQRAAEAAQPAPPVHSAAQNPSALDADTAPVPEESAPARLSSNVTASAGIAAPAPPVLALQIDILDEAWVKVTVDGEPTYQALMQSGESRSFRGADRIEVLTGNASAVVLTLNGETLPPLGHPGERKKVLLTLQDLRPAQP